MRKKPNVVYTWFSDTKVHVNDQAFNFKVIKQKQKYRHHDANDQFWFRDGYFRWNLETLKFHDHGKNGIYQTPT